MKVRLVTAVRLRPDAPLSLPGTVVDMDEDTLARFEGRGVFESVTARKPAPKPEPVVERGAEAPEPERVVKRGPNRPKRTASTADWKHYAEQVGVDIKGMSKQEIISAVDA